MADQVNMTNPNALASLIDVYTKGKQQTNQMYQDLINQRAANERIHNVASAYKEATNNPDVDPIGIVNAASEATNALSALGQHPAAQAMAKNIQQDVGYRVQLAKMNKKPQYAPHLDAQGNPVTKDVGGKKIPILHQIDDNGDIKLDTSGNPILSYDEKAAYSAPAPKGTSQLKGTTHNGKMPVSYDPATKQNMVTDRQGNTVIYDPVIHGTIDAVTEASQLRIAETRGESYARSRAKYNVKTVIDKNTGETSNKTSLEMINNPDRYVDTQTGQKVMTKSAIIEDIRGNIRQNREAIDSLDTDFNIGFKSKLAVALRSTKPSSALSRLVSSEAASMLTEKQLDFVNSLQFLTENAMALRGVLGTGPGSEDLRNAIVSTLPGVLSPNKQYAKKQLDLFEKTLDRLKKGVPDSGGGYGITPRADKAAISQMKGERVYTKEEAYDLIRAAKAAISQLKREQQQGLKRKNNGK
jgi:ribosomal protein S8E